MNETQDRLMVRYVAREANSDELAQIQRLRLEDANFDATIAATERAWQAAAPQTKDRRFDTAMGWRNLARRLNLADTEGPMVMPVKHRWHPAWTGLVAAALLGMVILLVQMARPEHVRHYDNRSGQMKTQVLSDGSSVELAPGAVLDWDETGSERRAVLQGVATFNVQTSSHPFVVVTDQVQVRVLGTVFQVKNLPETTHVTVAEGRVKVKAPYGMAFLTADQGVTITAGGYLDRISPQGQPRLFDWSQNRLVFRDDHLIDVIQVLSARFDVVIQLADPSLADRTVTATFEGDDLGPILNDLVLALNLILERDDQRFILRAP